MDYVYLLIIKLISSVLLIQILGMFWYSDKIFGKFWKRYSGFKKSVLENNKNKMKRNFFISFISSSLLVLVLSFVFSLFYYHLIYSLIASGIIWLGFVLTTSLNSVLWEGKDFRVYLINNLYYLVGFVLVAIIFYI
jgi:hypothetical protein